MSLTYSKVVQEAILPQSTAALTAAAGGELRYLFEARDDTQFLPSESYLLLKFRMTRTTVAPLTVVTNAPIPGAGGILFDHFGERCLNSIEHAINGRSVGNVMSNRGGVVARALLMRKGDADNEKLGGLVGGAHASNGDYSPLDGTASVISVMVRPPLAFYGSTMPIPGGQHRLSLQIPGQGTTTVVAPNTNLLSGRTLQPLANTTYTVIMTDAIFYACMVTPQTIPRLGSLAYYHEDIQVDVGRNVVSGTTATQSFTVPATTFSLALSFSPASDDSRQPVSCSLDFWEIRYRGRTIPTYRYSSIFSTGADVSDRYRAFADNAARMRELGLGSNIPVEYSLWQESPVYMIDTSHVKGDTDTILTLTYKHDLGVDVVATLVAFTSARIDMEFQNNSLVRLEAVNDTF